MVVCSNCHKGFEEDGFKTCPACRAKRREYDRRPDQVEKRREYLSRPEVHEHKCEYYREYQREYRKRPGVKERERRNRQKPENKERVAAYGYIWRQKPENKELQLEGTRKYRALHLEECRKRDRELKREKRKQPEFLEKLRAIQRKSYWKNKEQRNKLGREIRITLAGRYTEAKHSAKRRGIPFELTQEQHSTIIRQPCFWCGVTPNGSDETLNGVDRINHDKTIGYVLDNVIPACTGCNKGRNTMTVDEVVGYVEQVFQWQHLRTLTGTPLQRRNGKVELSMRDYYGKYKGKAKKRNIPFELSFEEFFKTVKRPCYVCGYHHFEDKGHTANGIDRFNNAVGYTVDNSLPACKWCNVWKGEGTYAELLDRFTRIRAGLRKNANQPR
jgi:hypothetical protein